jgi:DNA topoisomerase VI subunit A
MVGNGTSIDESDLAEVDLNVMPGVDTVLVVEKETCFHRLATDDSVQFSADRRRMLLVTG